MHPMAQRHLARHRPRRQALRDDRCLLLDRPATAPRRPAQHLHPAETLSLRWLITWITIHCPPSRKGGTSHRFPTHRQCGGPTPLTFRRWFGWIALVAFAMTILQIAPEAVPLL